MDKIIDCHQHPRSRVSQQPVVESATTDRSESEVEVEEQVISDEGGPEAEPEASSTEENQATAVRSQPETEVTEVEIPM